MSYEGMKKVQINLGNTNFRKRMTAVGLSFKTFWSFKVDTSGKGEM